MGGILIDREYSSFFIDLLLFVVSSVVITAGDWGEVSACEPISIIVFNEYLLEWSSR